MTNWYIDTEQDDQQVFVGRSVDQDDERLVDWPLAIRNGGRAVSRWDADQRAACGTGAAEGRVDDQLLFRGKPVEPLRSVCW